MTSLTSVTKGLDVSRETRERLEHFEQLFRKWSRAINLVAPSTQAEFWTRHIADSLQVSRIIPGPKQWADLGSGGGFPGIITAIVMAELGDGWVHLVESNNKKASFLREALRETGARGSVHPIRIEAAPAEIGAVDAISARALADLDQLLAYVAPWADQNPALICCFHKGRDYQREVKNAHGRWAFDLVEHPSKVETGSVILEIKAISPLKM